MQRRTPDLRRAVEGLKNILDRESKKKAAKEFAMEAEKVKVQDEKDMLDVQGAKDGGRMGYKSGTTLAELEKEKSGSDKKIDKFAFVHIEKMKKKKKETGPGSSNPKRVQRNLGGRMGYKDGSKGCKLATKGRGNAYGKNS